MSLKKIWTDPVWSKVISAGILGLIALFYTRFLSVSENITFKEAFERTLKYKISVAYVIFSVIGYWILVSVGKKLFKNKKDNSFYSKKQQTVRSFNKTLDQTTGILFRWGVYFNYDTPFIADLTAFCTKHGETPLRFVHHRCPVYGCQNSFKQLDEHAVKNIIESELINKWESIK